MEDPELPAGLTRSGMLQQLMDNIPDNIYFKDARGRIVLISRWGARWLGFDSRSEIIGKTDYDLFTEEHAAAAFADEQRIIATGEPVVGIEEKETWPDGTSTWASTTKMPLRDDAGNIVGTFGISRDITRRKEAELLIKRLKEQMESELALAGDVQRSFLPPADVHFPESPATGHGSLHVVHEYRPSGPVGGDFFCLLPLSATRIGILVADVMGHGVGAALTMSALNAMARSEVAPQLDTPDAFLRRLNRRLREILPQKDSLEFVTAFYLVIDSDDGTFRFATAGHHPPVVIRANSPEAKKLCSSGEIGGPALLLLEQPTFKTCESQLQSGDRILLFTDGLTEMPSAPGSEEDFELSGLLRLVNELPAQDLSSLIKATTAGVLAASGLDEFQDDMCLIGIEYRNPPS